MATIAESATVARGADDVWALLADFGAIARWAPNVDHSSMTTEAEGGLGATRRVQLGRNALLEVVEEWVPSERLTYRINGLPPVLKNVTTTWTLAPKGDSTTVVMTTVIDAGSRPPQRLVARGVGRAMAKASRQMLTGLQTTLEEGVHR